MRSYEYVVHDYPITSVEIKDPQSNTVDRLVSMAFLSIFLGIVATGIAALYFYLRRRYGSIEHLGIPIVKPFLCFGSPPFFYHRITTHEYYEKVSYFNSR
jgi:hypothetical protein